jgi:hypothetical protein
MNIPEIALNLLKYGGLPALLLFLIVLFAYWIFKLFGKNWISNYFSKELEEFKKEKEKELIEYKHNINALFNRITKIHEKEIEVLPQAWDKLQDAIGYISYLTSYLRQYPDFDNMPPEAIEDFLKGSKLKDSHKKELRKAEHKNAYYMRKIFFYELADSKKTFHEFNNYIIKNRIFLSDDLKNEFSKAADLLQDAIIDKEIGKQSESPEFTREAYRKIQNEIDPIRDEIERLVQKRLKFLEAD